MNPYFPSSYGYSPPMTNQFAYNQPTHPVQSVQGYPQMNQINTIESMYTAVHPYDNKQFLITTFGNKIDYIKIFLTLSHQDKLKMYLLMEEKKIYGEITDKEAYQKILKEIVQKLQNYNTFHQIKPKIQNTEELKKKDLESKIDSFCQVSFQKLNLSKIGADNKKSPKITDIDQINLDDEWVESKVEQNEKENKQVAKIQAEKAENQFNSFYNLENNKQNVSNSTPNSQTATNPVIFNMFTFDSDMERAMTKQIGLKTANQIQKLSIWQLQVEQSELKTNEPNIKQVFKRKDSTSEAIKNEVDMFQKKQNSSQQVNGLDLYSKYTNKYSQQINFINQKPTENINQIYPSFSTKQAENDYNMFNFNQQAPPTTQLFTFDKQPQNELIFDTNIEPNLIQNHFEQGQQKISIPSNIETNLYQFPIQTQSKPIQYIPQEEIPSITQVKPAQLSQNLFDFDMMVSNVQTQTIISQQAVDLFLSSSSQPKVQIQSQKIMQNNPVFIPDIPQQIIQTVVELDYQPNIILNSQLFLPENQKKYEIIDHLKIQFSEGEKQKIIKQLKSKSFECNSEFYLKILNHLRNISMQSSTEFVHFSEQYKISKEMHELTQKYTTVVDEQDEQKVEQAVRQSKALYNQIYNKSTLTQKFVQHLLSQKNKEKGLEYKFGKMLIDSCINAQLIIKASTQENKKNILNSFCLLFILQKNNSLNKLKSIAEALITCINQQFQKYKSLDQQLLRTAQQKCSNFPKMSTYIKGFLRIVSICERMIQLMKNCFVKTNSNLVKTLKICKDIKNRFPNFIQSQQRQELFPTAYGNIIKQCLQKNCSLYELHAKYSIIVDKTPVCQICLFQLEGLGECHQQKGWYHYACFNLMKSISNLDYI